MRFSNSRWITAAIISLAFGSSLSSARAQTPQSHDAPQLGDAHGSVVNRLVVPSTGTPKGAAAPPRALPPPPPGVTALAWDEFFVSPVGPYGLELTNKFKNLDGKRVRIAGFMVGQENATPGAFIFAGRPFHIEDDEDGLSALPANVVRVVVPQLRNKKITFTPHPLLLTGTLSVGNAEEKDGAVYLARLVLDPALKPTPKALARVAKPTALKR